MSVNYPCRKTNWFLHARMQGRRSFVSATQKPSFQSGFLHIWKCQSDRLLRHAQLARDHAPTHGGMAHLRRRLAFKTLRGRPRCLPCLCASATPDFTRSTMMFRSNSASMPRSCSVNFPKGLWSPESTGSAAEADRTLHAANCRVVATKSSSPAPPRTCLPARQPGAAGIRGAF